MLRAEIQNTSFHRANFTATDLSKVKFGMAGCVLPIAVAHGEGRPSLKIRWRRARHWMTTRQGGVALSGSLR